MKTSSFQTELNFSIVSEVALVYKNRVKPADRPQIDASASAYKIFRDTWDHTFELCESFRLMLLNRSNKVLGITTISTGGLTGTVVDVRLIMQYALKGNASSLIICHNHPSGNTKPSENDIQVTRRIKAAGTLLDINLVDHLILTPDNKYLSFADEGLL